MPSWTNRRRQPSPCSPGRRSRPPSPSWAGGSSWAPRDVRAGRVAGPGRARGRGPWPTRPVPAADQSLRADVRRDRVVLTLQSCATGRVTAREIDLAGRISALVRRLGLATSADGPRRTAQGPRSVQILEIGDRRAGHRRPSGRSGRRCSATSTSPAATGRRDALVDPSGRGRRSGSSRWTRHGRSATGSTSTSRCRTTRPPHRIAAALAAGGTLRHDAEAPGLLGAGRRRGQRGVRDHLAGPRDG